MMDSTTLRDRPLTALIRRVAPAGAEVEIELCPFHAPNSGASVTISPSPAGLMTLMVAMRLLPLTRFPSMVVFSNELGCCLCVR